MSDDLTKRGPQDRTKINIHEPWELKYWSGHFGVAPDELIEAVRAVGPSVEAVERFLREKKTYTIIVEGKPHKWAMPSISYAEVVTLEVPTYPQHPEITYSVKYKHGPHENPEGVLAPGGSVTIKNRMVFSVSETGQS